MSPPIVAASAPQRVRQWLRECPDGTATILHPGRHAVYLEVAGRCVGVVGTAAVAVPCALRLASTDLGGLGTGSARIEAGELYLDDTAVRIGRTVDAQVPRLRRQAASGVHSCDGSALVARVGEGGGLTPEADDVLCGWLAIHRAAGVATPDLDAAVRSVLDRTTLLSATLLQCAIDGEVIPEFAAWVAALGTPAAATRAAALARIGHTSGAALLRGAELALAHLDLEGTRAA